MGAMMGGMPSNNAPMSNGFGPGQTGPSGSGPKMAPQKFRRGMFIYDYKYRADYKNAEKGRPGACAENLLCFKPAYNRARNMTRVRISFPNEILS